MTDVIRRHIWRTSLLMRYPKIFSFYKNLEKSQWLSREEIHDSQQRKLKALVEFAYRNVPYYAETWRKMGFHPDDLTPEIYKQLPVLKKQTIKERFDDLICRDLLKKARLNSTGGSTGEPIQFYQDRLFPSIFYAAAFRHNRWAGWRFGDPVLRLWGNPTDIKGGLLRKINRRISGSTTINAFKLNEEAFEKAYKILTIEKPSTLIGYSSAVVAFAKYLEETSRPVNHSLSGIIASAEVLTEEMRQTIQRVFGVKVYDRYGSREVGLISSQCEYGSMHVNDENILIEFEEVSGGMSKIVITDLNNRVMPFIRYSIGDVGCMSRHVCECGRGLTVIGEISGRTTDLLVTAEGDIISGPALTLVFKDLKEVKQVQLYQPRRSRLIVRLVRGVDYNSDLEDLTLSRLQKYFGVRMQIEFKYMDVIPVESSGKYRFAISDVYN